MFKKSLMALALVGTVASAQAGVLLKEDFNSVAALQGNGWVLNNASTPAGSVAGWFQGDQSQFAAFNGSAESYAAANFNNAAPGGVLANWLITPEFSTATDVVVSFWAKAVLDAGFADHLSFGSSGGSSDLAAFSLGSAITVAGDWTRYTLHVTGNGAGSMGRFAIQYTGLADEANAIGVDALEVSQIPEPASLLLFGAGLLGLAGLRRRGAK